MTPRVNYLPVKTGTFMSSHLVYGLAYYNLSFGLYFNSSRNVSYNHTRKIPKDLQTERSTIDGNIMKDHKQS